MKVFSYKNRLTQLLGLTLWLGLLMSSPAMAAGEPVCAEVKIEILQELTLERQGFDARMKINNELDAISLENVTINVNFADREGNTVLASSDPNSTDAKFFIRIDSMEGIDSIDGGTVAPQTTADIHWLIVPTVGASADNVNGTLYFVGANLSYTVGGELEEVNVAPDFIRVKPLPEITLDYFLTRYVNADDPLTNTIEAIEPFTLGVRVQNNGTGLAKNLNIESAQPKIVENEQGLLIDFKIIGSTVNNEPAAPTLLINFGDIASGDSVMGRWLMQTTLAGEFTEFTASFSHADELGGQLTSVLKETNTHFLVHDVLVDLPGRDVVRDFLADNYGEYKVYESNGVDTLVENQSAAASLAYTQQVGLDSHYTLTATATDGFSYVSLDDTFQGAKVIKQVIRSDGKILPLDNAWFSKERVGSGNYNYRFNLFDVKSTGSYTVIMQDKVDVPLEPVLQFIPDRTTHEGKKISFLVEASDPNGTVPTLSAVNLPEGATLTEQGGGVAVFAWTPIIGQAGKYEITYQASDGTSIASRKAFITVNSATDTDGDGMDDAWEMEHFGTLDRDGTGDFDGDGISDLDEFKNQQDPNVPNAFNFVFDSASLGTTWQDISINAFVNPVVFAGVATDNDTDAALVRIRNLKTDGFKLKLQEWTYQDGTHALEAVPYMVLEAGRHTMSDGSIWEVGTFEVVSEQRWQKHDFIQEFTDKPQVYLTIQTNNDSDPVVVRAKGVTKTGFEAALFEEEANSDHSRELVGYVAIYAPESTGNINIAASDFTFSSEILPINNEDLLLADGVTTLHLEEEQSLDDEVLHEHEDVAVLNLGGAVFAQDNSTKYTDTIALRKHINVSTVATPVISPKGGLISKPTTVTLSSMTSGALIYYTLDGTTPDPINNAAATQLYATPIAINATTTLKVIAKLDGIADSLENTAMYTLVANTPPEFITIPDRTVTEGHSISFMVQALDQNTINQAPLSVDLSGLQGSPVFIDNGDGTGRFSWIPPEGTANAAGYTLNFVATDAADATLTATESMKIIVTSNSILDSDNDGMPDAWENQYSLDPNDPADADGDADGDGISNYDEYQRGSNPLIKDIIPDNVPPVAKITSDVLTGSAPLTVQLTGSESVDPDGSIVAYAWVTSDGASYSGVSVSHTFTDIGTYTVDLTVTDNSGADHTDTITIEVTESNNLPIANIVATPMSGTVPLVVGFDASSSTDSDGSIIEYSWDFGDNSSSEVGVTVSHTYTSVGQYSAVLTVTDDKGGVSSKIASINVFAVGSDITIYEDAENGDTVGWRVYDQDPTGATITNVFDIDKQSNIIELNGSATKNGYILGNYEGRDGSWNNSAATKLQWRSKYNEAFTVFIRVTTTKGPRYLYYTASKTDNGMNSNGRYIHHGLGFDARDGMWHTHTRDLVADLRNFEPDNELLAVHAFLVRGSGRVDDISLSTSLDVPDVTAPVISLNGASGIELNVGDTYTEEGATAVDAIDGAVMVTILGSVDTSKAGLYSLVYEAIDAAGNKASTLRTVHVLSADGSTLYEDAENGDTLGWRVYDQDPAGATIANVVDADKQSNVIELNGSATKNGYILGNFEGRDGSWNNSTATKLQWRSKYNEAFTVFIRVTTTKGPRYLYYTASNTDRGMNSNGRYIHHGLGFDARDGMWHTHTRDLVADLRNFEPDNELLTVHAFLIRGSGRVDDILLSATLDVPDVTAPVISLNGASGIELNVGDTYTEEGATAVDAIDGAVTVTILGSVDTSKASLYSLVYEATDATGNKTSVIRTVNVLSADGSTLYEDAENGDTMGWRVYDQDPAGATIANVVDADKQSNVIEFNGNATQNGYILGDYEGKSGSWNNSAATKLQWRSKYNEAFTVFIRVTTTKGWRYLYYTASNTDSGINANGKYIHHGLGIGARDGAWHTFNRDLASDLNDFEPDNELLAVHAFLLRGSGRIDDIVLNP